ncbi:hypothetical protein AB6G29_22415 [Providencia hangzhouensis]|uniref:hypothetical protein n=1 Tax=Providencia hangzhouensis TaxID=3031799 RepID=UPI0034DD7C73
MSTFFPVNPESGKSILQRQSQALLQNGHLERARQLRNLAIAGRIRLSEIFIGTRSEPAFAIYSHLHQRTLIDTLWNTGDRIHEALALTKGDFYLDEETPFVVLRTLKQRETQTKAKEVRVKARPKRIVALFDSPVCAIDEKLLCDDAVDKSKPDCANPK